MTKGKSLQMGKFILQRSEVRPMRGSLRGLSSHQPSEHDAQSARHEAAIQEENHKAVEDLSRLIHDHPELKDILAEQTKIFAEECNACPDDSKDHPLAWYWCREGAEPSLQSKCAMLAMYHDIYVRYNRICEEAKRIYPDLEKQVLGFMSNSRHGGQTSYCRLFFSDLFGPEGCYTPEVKKKDGGGWTEPKYSPGEAAESLAMKTRTLNKHAKDIGVPTPGRGQRNFRYPESDLIKIAESLKSHSEKKIRDRADSLLKLLGGGGPK